MIANLHFRDRADAGRQLVRLVQQYEHDRPVVIGIPNGGLVTAAPVALALKAPLETWVAIQVHAPEQPEAGLGALAEGGFAEVDRREHHWVGSAPAEIEALIARRRQQVSDRAGRLRGGRPHPVLRDRTVIVVDDGVTTGRTARAVLQVIRTQRPKRLVLATPVGSISILAELRKVADGVHALVETRSLVAIGAWYRDFARVSEPEATAVLTAAKQGAEVMLPTEQLRESQREVDIRLDGVVITGHLCIPTGAEALVIAAHGSGSGRFSPRNRFIASELRKRGLATFVLDLLTHREELRDFETGALRFDIELLARRLVVATEWAAQAADTRRLHVGYLGAATAAAAQIAAAVRRPLAVRATVVQGGRPDLAHKYLGRLVAPTLLIAGASDPLKRFERARVELSADTELQLLPGASQPFDEPGALEQVCELAGDWFDRRLRAAHHEQRTEARYPW